MAAADDMAETDPRPSIADIGAAFVLTGYFLDRRVLEPRGGVMPEARQSFLATVLGRRLTG
jgi:DNA repair protein RecO (recombination protein O)